MKFHLHGVTTRATVQRLPGQSHRGELYLGACLGDARSHSAPIRYRTRCLLRENGFYAGCFPVKTLDNSLGDFSFDVFGLANPSDCGFISELLPVFDLFSLRHPVSLNRGLTRVRSGDVFCQFLGSR